MYGTLPVFYCCDRMKNRPVSPKLQGNLHIQIIGNTLREVIFAEEVFVEENFAEFIFLILPRNCQIKSVKLTNYCAIANINSAKLIFFIYIFYIKRQWMKRIKFINIVILSPNLSYIFTKIQKCQTLLCFEK